MKRIFLDTNFILDYLLREEYRAQSEDFMEACARIGCKFFISYLSVANFAYIVRKLPKDDLYRLLKTITELFEVIPNDSIQLRRAIELNADDFEDVLQYQSAISYKCDCIITRNEKDFIFSEIPVMSAPFFMQKYI